MSLKEKKVTVRVGQFFKPNLLGLFLQQFVFVMISLMKDKMFCEVGSHPFGYFYHSESHEKFPNTTLRISMRRCAF